MSRSVSLSIRSLEPDPKSFPMEKKSLVESISNFRCLPTPDMSRKKLCTYILETILEVDKILEKLRNGDSVFIKEILSSIYEFPNFLIFEHFEAPSP